MKGAVAVMIELALAGAPVALPVLRPRGAARARVRARAAAGARAARRRAGRDDGADANELHAGCLGNINATWTFHGRSGHSARPWLADNAIERAAAGRAGARRAPPVPHAFDGLEFVEVATVTRIAGGIAMNVIPDRVGVPRELPLRARPRRPRRPRRGWPSCAPATASCGSTRTRPRARSRPGRPSTRSSPRAGSRARPSRPGRRSRSSAQAGLDAVNFGPGEPAQAHRRDESVADRRARCAPTRCWSGSRHEARPRAHREWARTRSSGSPRRSGGCWRRAST